MKLAQAHAGWVKISHEEAPSTAAVGNTHILAAAAKLSKSFSTLNWLLPSNQRSHWRVLARA